MGEGLCCVDVRKGTVSSEFADGSMGESLCCMEVARCLAISCGLHMPLEMVQCNHQSSHEGLGQCQIPSPERPALTALTCSSVVWAFHMHLACISCRYIPNGTRWVAPLHEQHFTLNSF